MNSRLMEECRRSFFKELYHMDRPGYSVVTDETSGKIYVRKELKIYDRSVYEYLKKHRCPHIPNVYEVWEKDGMLTVIEAFIQGDPLSRLMEKHILSDDRKKEILLQICDALTLLHNAEPPIIHRDVKADNIMVAEDGRAYLIDYNAAKIYHENQTRDTILLGTEGSAAPEQYGFRQSDARTDIYGMGILIRDMFPEDEHMRKISEKAVRMEPDERYQTARELKRAIEKSNTYRRWTTSHKAGGMKKHKRGINLPGFRTGSLWKMIVAVAGYLLIFYCGFTLMPDHPKSSVDIWLNRIFFLLVCGSLIDFYTDWTHLLRNFPLIHSRNPGIRLLGYALGTVVITFLWIIILLIIEIFL